jgi:hypothetical protein
MKVQRIGRAGSLLGLIILAAVIWYGPSARMLVAGGLYLMIASCLCLASVLLAATVKVKQRRGIADSLNWAQGARAYAFLLSAWQLAIVGLLNIWAVDYSRNPVVFALSYVLAVLFIACCSLMVRVTDKSNQAGGAKLLNYFGRPRSRSLFFYGFCYIISPFLFVGIRVFFLSRPSPAPFQPPQLCLLFATLSNFISTGMVIQRYRQALPDKALASRAIVLTVCALISQGVIQMIFRYSTYMYVLSSITFACTASSLYWLLLARYRAFPLTTEQGSSGTSVLDSLGSGRASDSPATGPDTTTRTRNGSSAKTQ